MIAKQILQSLGMQVIEAANGEEAIDVLTRESVDIVLMDCQMPVLDGYAATREIRRLEAKAGLLGSRSWRSPRMPSMTMRTERESRGWTLTWQSPMVGSS